MNEINSEEKKYFNYHLKGIGYLNNFRTAITSSGRPYMLVKVALLHGPVESPRYSYFDCKIVGSIAKEVIKACAEPINSIEDVVFVQVTLTEIWAMAYLSPPTDDNEAQHRPNLRASLLSIRKLMINGEVFYTAPVNEENKQEKEEADFESPARADDTESTDPTDPPDEPGPSGAPALPPVTDAEEAA